MKRISIATLNAVAIVLIAPFCTCLAPAQTFVYDTVVAGTYAYETSPTGKLTLVKGSPFPTAGSLVGTNGKFFVTADTNNLFSYAVESNGGLGKLVSTINTQLYSGSECGTMGFVQSQGSGKVAQFDHTGAVVYVPLTNYDDVCDAIQTFAISKTGVFTFKGVAIYDQEANDLYNPSMLTITGNGKFA